MSYNLRKVYRKPINFTDEFAHALMSEGRIGALSLIMHIISMRPDSEKLLSILDDMNIRGEQLYCAFNDWAEKDLVKFIEGTINKNSEMIDFININSGSLWEAVLDGASTVDRPQLRKPFDHEFESEYYDIVINELAMFFVYEEIKGSNPTLYGTMITEAQAENIFKGKYKYYPLIKKHIEYGIEVSPRIIPQKAGLHATP